MEIKPTYVSPEHFKLLREKDNYFYLMSKAEQWKVVEWLRVSKGIWVYTVVEDNKWTYAIIKTSNSYSGLTTENLVYNSPQEAYSAAFDHIFAKLI